MGRGERLVSRPRVLRREAVVSLDTSCAPAILLCGGNLWSQKTASAPGRVLQQPGLALCLLHSRPDIVLPRRWRIH